MAIYIDVSAAVHQRAGLGRYAASLARALVPIVGERLALFYNRESGGQPPAGLGALPARTVKLGYKPWRMLVWLGHLARVGFDRYLPQAELFHATEHLLPYFRALPAILTVHDLVFLHLPQHHKPLNRWFLRLAMPLFCRRADHLIAVSAHTRDDLLRTYGLSSDRITVVHEAAEACFQPQPPAQVSEVLARYGIPRRYLLSVGTIEPRKNLSRLLAAFEALHAQGLTDALVHVGRRGWLVDDFFQSLRRSPVRHAFRWLDAVNDETLAALYSGAQAFVLVSEHEGFGLPVVEAMACGAPVVCSSSSSLPEVAGQAALLVDPRHVDAIATGLRQVLQDEVLASRLRQNGLLRARQFSWERTAKATLAVYEQAILSASRRPRAVGR